MRHFVRENNSFGRWVVGCGYVEIEADCEDEAIRAFEQHFNLDWNHQNSYEGNSCNCCGRRFTLYSPRGYTTPTLDNYGQIEYYDTQDDVYSVDGNPLLVIGVPSEQTH